MGLGLGSSRTAVLSGAVGGSTRWCGGGGAASALRRAVGRGRQLRGPLGSALVAGTATGATGSDALPPLWFALFEEVGEGGEGGAVGVEEGREARCRRRPQAQASQSRLVEASGREAGGRSPIGRFAQFCRDELAHGLQTSGLRREACGASGRARCVRPGEFRAGGTAR